jgi:carboxypeptidase family protein
MFLFCVMWRTALRAPDNDCVDAPTLSRQRFMMRVQILLLTLASTPLVAAVAQTGAAAVKDPAQCQVADSHRSPTAWSQQHPADPQGRARTGCSPVVLSQDPPSGEAGSISGSVWNDGTGEPLSGWVVVLSGPSNASTVTDAWGGYRFTGLAGGLYTVCEVVQGGWQETSPTFQAACASGLGYNFTLTDGGSASFVDFGNMVM